MENKLYWKFSLVFLVLLVLIGGLFVFVTTQNATLYFDEANQRLHKNLAEQTVAEVQPLVDGEVDTNAIQDIMHSMMVINPSVEVYLLDPNGEIITYVAPKKKIKVDRVPLQPIRTFLNQEDVLVKGLDPRHPENLKVFSAATLMNEELLEGYIYIILASEEQKSVLAMLSNSYVLNSGFKIFLISLLLAILITLFTLRYLTKNLRTITNTVESFQNGNLQARIPRAKTRDFKKLALSINDMADKISSNIEEIKKVDNLRKELIANISHDLRTPLSIISGYVETMIIKEDLTNEEKEKYLNRILLNISNLAKLIEQLFEYSKLEAKEIKPHKEAFSIKDLVYDLVYKFEGLAKEKNITLTTNIGSNLPLVYADIAMVDRAISNLIDNAIKYSTEGNYVGINLDNEGDEVKVAINDNGPGIPLQQQEHIFERFKKYDRSPVNKKSAGLGLAIVKKILEIHEKSIGILSEPGKGTSFYFHLPVKS